MADGQHETDHAATVQAIYEAFGRGDVAAILDRLQDDVRWDEGIRETAVPYLQPGVGRDHVADFFATVGTNLRFEVFEPLAICTGSDTVIVALREGGENVSTGGELPEDVTAHMWVFGEDGKVAAFRHIGDWYLHERAAGLVPADVRA